MSSLIKSNTFGTNNITKSISKSKSNTNPSVKGENPYYYTNEEILERDKDRSKFAIIVEFLFNGFSSIMRFIGPFFFLALCLFVILVASAFFSVILPTLDLHWIFEIVLEGIATVLLIQIFFNYGMAYLVKPGGAKEIAVSKYYSENSPYVVNSINLYEVFRNKISNKIMENHPQFNNAYKVQDSIDSVETDSEVIDSIDTEIVENKNTNSNIIDQKNNLETDNGENADNIENFELDTDIKVDNKENENGFSESSSYNRNNENIILNIQLPNISSNSDSSQNNSELVENPLKFCKYCDDYKPLRAHHCSICGYCVFKMDHHCPWINNCVGQNNHRYFILFLTWIYIGCWFVVLTATPIYFKRHDLEFESDRKKTEFSFIVVLCLAGIGILTLFNLWNWFLIFRGLTTIEFWIHNPKMSKNRYTVINDFNLGYKNNFYLVFGTRSLLKAILIPSIARLPISGLEWSKIVYQKCSFKGVKDINAYSNLNSEDAII